MPSNKFFLVHDNVQNSFTFKFFRDVKTSTVDILAKAIFFNSMAITNFSFELWETKAAKTISIRNDISNTKVQNWEKNVRAFFLFRDLITLGSSKLRMDGELSCL